MLVYVFEMRPFMVSLTRCVRFLLPVPNMVDFELMFEMKFFAIPLIAFEFVDP